MSAPAFPQHGWSSSAEVLARMSERGGMTMRQYYKAAALGFLERNIHGVSAEHLATRAAEIADAMLAEDERSARP